MSRCSLVLALSFTFIRSLFQKLLSSGQVVSSAYFKLWIFLPPVISPPSSEPSPVGSRGVFCVPIVQIGRQNSLSVPQFMGHWKWTAHPENACVRDLGNTRRGTSDISTRNRDFQLVQNPVTELSSESTTLPSVQVQPLWRSNASRCKPG